MGLKIIDKKVHARDLLNRQLDRHDALVKQAHHWASMQLGDPEKLPSVFLEKINDVRRMDVLGYTFIKSAKDIGDSLRQNPPSGLHSDRIFDLEKLLELL